MSIRAAWLRGALVSAPLTALAACGPKPIPDPRITAQRWADAVHAKDAAAVYALSSDAARRAQGIDGMKAALETYSKELGRLANEVAAPSARLNMTADVALPDERSARVVVEDGRFRIAAASALPAAASTPEEALKELREVLQRRSFAGLIHVLTRDTGRGVESSIADLVKALDEPAALEIDLEGRRATARLPGGHIVKIEQEDGVWRIKDFD